MKKSLFAFVVVIVFGFSVGHCQSGAFFLCATNQTQYHYLDSTPSDPTKLASTLALLEPPPVPDEKASEEEIKRLLKLQDSRTQTEILQARADANELDIFIFKSLLGSAFNDSNPSLTDVLRLSQNVCEDANAVLTVQNAKYMRLRPFLENSNIHIQVDPAPLKTSYSYPSGHATISYLEALVLADILPDDRAALLKRAEEFGRERNLLGVHYFSDVEAGQKVAIAIHDELVKLSAYRRDLQRARTQMAKFQRQPF